MSAEIEICYGNGMPFVCDSPAAAETPPTAREPVKVTEEDMAFFARYCEEADRQQLANCCMRLRLQLNAALSAHHPEVQPAEPMAKHWREALKEVATYLHAEEIDRIEQRARELAGKDRA